MVLAMAAPLTAQKMDHNYWRQRLEEGMQKSREHSDRIERDWQHRQAMEQQERIHREQMEQRERIHKESLEQRERTRIEIDRCRFYHSERLWKIR